MRMEYHFKYNITVDDFAEYNAYTAWYAPWLKKARFSYFLRTFFYSAITMTATFIVLNKIRSTRQNNYTFLAILGITLLLILTLIAYHQAPYGIKNKARKLVLKDENSHILNETELTINNSGILNNDNVSSVHQKWSSVVRYAITKDYFYLYTNSIQAQIVPKRLFTSQKEIEEFENFLTGKIPLSSSFRSMNI
jgi:uncharacterized membrane protein